MLEMDDVVSQCQRAGSRRRGRLPITARTAQATGTPKNFMVGEHPECGHHEPAAQRAYRESRSNAGATAILKQLLHPLQRTFIVAQDQRGRITSKQRTEPVEIAIDSLGRKEAELQVNCFTSKRETREGLNCGTPVVRRREDRVTTWDLLAETSRNLQVVLGLIPCPGHLVEVRPKCLFDDDRVGRK